MRIKIAITLCLCMLAGQPIMAGLKVVGPINPNNGFPMWIMDQENKAVMIGLDGDGTTGLGVFDPVDPSNPFSVQIGWGGEAFYWTSDAIVTFANGDDARLIMGVEVTFGGDGSPVDGQQLVFTRIRIRFESPVSGTYTVTHPYGVQVFNNVAAGERVVWTSDTGGFAPFQGVLDGPAPVLLSAVNPAPPAGYLGNPQVLQTVTGSPSGNNLFRIEGPVGSNLGGQGVRFVQTNLFAVSGKLYEFAPGEAFCEAPVAGDLNNDCKVDISDLSVLASNWLDCNLVPAQACAD